MMEYLAMGTGIILCGRHSHFASFLSTLSDRRLRDMLLENEEIVSFYPGSK